MSSLHPWMEARDGADPILERVKVQGEVEATLARVRFAQTYRNPGKSNIEAVYTFPLPPQSTLLGVEAELAGKRFHATVCARAASERQYEEAIEKGDTAILVESPEPGLHVMNLGNLMPGESITVEVEFAMLLDWHEGALRISLPMTLAPRYDEARSRLEPQQKPAVDAIVERRFSLAFRFSEFFRGATVGSPTHPIATRQDDHGIHIELQRGEAWMDRDFVLCSRHVAPPAMAMAQPDADGTVVYASFQIPPANASPAPREVKVVIDCSGSMAGHSIGLARAGVLRLLEKLREGDRFGMVAFGSVPATWTASMRQASELDIQAASAWVRARQADMGGTEMAEALSAAIAIKGSAEQCDLFLITDGEVARTGELTTLARRSGHRLFVAAVGASPQQAAMRELAETTGGAIEFVGPGEYVDDAIHRLFCRLVELPVGALQVQGDGAFEWQSSTPAHAAFSGDTIHFFGRVEGPAPVKLRASWQGAQGRVWLDLPVAASSAQDGAIPRIGAALRIRELQRSGADAADVAALAVRYQLATSETNYILTIDRAEDRATSLPEMKQVTHMLAAGYAGIGDLLGSLDDDIGGFDIEESQVELAQYAPLDEIQLRDALTGPATCARFIKLASVHMSLKDATPLPLTIDELARLGLGEPEVAILRELAASASESAVVLAFWTCILVHEEELGIGRGLRRAMTRAGLPRGVDVALFRDLNARLKGWIGAEAVAPS